MIHRSIDSRSQGLLRYSWRALPALAYFSIAPPETVVASTLLISDLDFHIYDRLIKSANKNLMSCHDDNLQESNHTRVSTKQENLNNKSGHRHRTGGSQNRTDLCVVPWIAEPPFCDQSLAEIESVRCVFQETHYLQEKIAKKWGCEISWVCLLV